MSWIMVDVEADGPYPKNYSMISIGAVVVEPRLEQTFHANLAPISPHYLPEALKISGFTREETKKFADPGETIERFANWLEHIGKPMFISDNNGFDWQFVNYYLHHYIGRNPFGHSSTNLGSLYKGMNESMFVNFKHLRKTKHTHNPLDDAMGNAEALLEMKKMGLRINL